MTLPSAMTYDAGVLRLLDQRLLPESEHWLPCQTLEQVAQAIETMVIRGAPAIGIAALFALAVDAHHNSGRFANWGSYQKQFATNLQRLRKTRPTAVNLFFELSQIEKQTVGLLLNTPFSNIGPLLRDHAQDRFAKDVEMCRAIGESGADLFAGKSKVVVMTHCNTGALATAGWGTALGVIRSLAVRGKLGHVYVNETRPFRQGARLTCFELMKEGISHSLQVDSAAPFLMRDKAIDAVIVGADRVAANGDTVNKIGTYMVAIAAHHHGIPFYVAAPTTSFDPQVATGNEIEIEYRDPTEISQCHGKPSAPVGTHVLNPSFDITPGALVTSFITERGVSSPPFKF